MHNYSIVKILGESRKKSKSRPINKSKTFSDFNLVIHNADMLGKDRNLVEKLFSEDKSNFYL